MTPTARSCRCVNASRGALPYPFAYLYHSYKVLGALVALAKSLYRTVEAIVVQGWVFIIPEALRTRPPKIFMADDPVPGAMNKVFGLDVDTR